VGLPVYAPVCEHNQQVVVGEDDDDDGKPYNPKDRPISPFLATGGFGFNGGGFAFGAAFPGAEYKGKPLPTAGSLRIVFHVKFPRLDPAGSAVLRAAFASIAATAAPAAIATAAAPGGEGDATSATPTGPPADTPIAAGASSATDEHGDVEMGDVDMEDAHAAPAAGGAGAGAAAGAGAGADDAASRADMRSLLKALGLERQDRQAGRSVFRRTAASMPVVGSLRGDEDAAKAAGERRGTVVTRVPRKDKAAKPRPVTAGDMRSWDVVEAPSVKRLATTAHVHWSTCAGAIPDLRALARRRREEEAAAKAPKVEAKKEEAAGGFKFGGGFGAPAQPAPLFGGGFGGGGGGGFGGFAMPANPAAPAFAFGGGGGGGFGFGAARAAPFGGFGGAVKREGDEEEDDED
jgi:hypothetical protein